MSDMKPQDMSEGKDFFRAAFDGESENNFDAALAKCFEQMPEIPLSYLTGFVKTVRDIQDHEIVHTTTRSKTRLIKVINTLVGMIKADPEANILPNVLKAGCVLERGNKPNWRPAEAALRFWCVEQNILTLDNSQPVKKHLRDRLGEVDEEGWDNTPLTTLTALTILNEMAQTVNNLVGVDPSTPLEP